MAAPGPGVAPKPVEPPPAAARGRGAPPALPAPAKQRILCLHGFTQNTEIFRKRTGALRTALKKDAEFIFLDAPHSAAGAFDPADKAALGAAAAATPAGAQPPGGAAATSENAPAAGGEEGASQHGAAADASSADAPAAVDDVGPRAWWLMQESIHGRLVLRPSQSTQYVGWPETLALLRATLAEQGPFDGLLGFSQGAAAAALLLAALSADADAPAAVSASGAGGSEDGDRARAQPSVPWAILVGGFVPRDESLAAGLRAGPPRARTLHVFGQTDQLVPIERARELAGCFESPVTFEHELGHIIPSQAAFRNAAKAFVQEQAARRAGEIALPPA